MTGIVAVVVLVGLSPLEPSAHLVVAVLAAIGAAVSYAFAGTFVRRRLPFLSGIEVATGQLVGRARCVLLPFAVLSGPPGALELDSAVALLAVGTLSTALPWPIFFRLSAATTPTIASTVTFVVPAFAIAWGAIVLGEPIGVGLLIGFGAVIVSLVLVLGLGVPRSVPVPWGSRDAAGVSSAPFLPRACSSVDRALGSGPKGRRFESCRARHDSLWQRAVMPVASGREETGSIRLGATSRGAIPAEASLRHRRHPWLPADPARYDGRAMNSVSSRFQS